jgi:hypothetical protein
LQELLYLFNEIELTKILSDYYFLYEIIERSFRYLIKCTDNYQFIDHTKIENDNLPKLLFGINLDKDVKTNNKSIEISYEYELND